jgi:hypothetical protein
MKKKIWLITTIIVILAVMLSCNKDKTPNQKTSDINETDSDEIYSKGLTYEKNLANDGYTVLGIGTCTDTSIIIPKTYQGIAVVEIGEEAFKNCKNVTDIKLPDSITSIGASAFVGCRSLVNINVPDGVTSINYGTFAGCGNLKNITIPDSVVRIGDHAFNESGLVSISIPNSVTFIGSFAFYQCAYLENVKLPDGLKSIGESAFNGCGVTQISIPDGITAIEKETFFGCTKLTESHWNTEFFCKVL